MNNRIWSLWDMLQIDAGKVLSSFHLLVSFAANVNVAQAGLGRGGEPGVAYETFLEMLASAAYIKQFCVDHGLAVALPTVTEMESLMQVVGTIPRGADGNARLPNLLAIRLANRIDASYEQLTNEMKARTFLDIEPRSIRYYSQPDLLFGTAVVNGFPSLEHDITEAGKTLALDRGTACVFHLMRIMETTVRSLARCLDIPDPVKANKKHWDAISRTIKAALDLRNSTVPPNWANKDDKQLFDEMFVVLEAIRGCWRNPTMHPGRKYTPEEALQIFGAVTTFMKKIAARMDEAGLPLA
jgi:hypothetical protein